MMSNQAVRLGRGKEVLFPCLFLFGKGDDEHEYREANVELTNGSGLYEVRDDCEGCRVEGERNYTLSSDYFGW